MSAYFIHTDSEQAGPFTLEELKQKGISKDTPVWREDLPDWIKAGELPELNILFAPAPPPFVKKESEAPAPLQKNLPKPAASKGKKNRVVIIPVILLLVAAAIYFYFNSAKNKTGDVNKEKMAVAKSDSSAKKDIANGDTAKKINLDTLSNWMNDTIASGKKNGAEGETGFTMGGIPVNNKKEADKDNSKKKEKKDAVQPEEKKPEKIAVTNETHEAAPVRTKNLQITGSFRKNLLFEAVLEGRIQNPNDNVSFRNISVTVEFLSAGDESLGTKQFPQGGAIGGGESVSFKFKTNAPKGTKTARYSVSGAAF